MIVKQFFFHTNIPDVTIILIIIISSNQVLVNGMLNNDKGLTKNHIVIIIEPFKQLKIKTVYPAEQFIMRFKSKLLQKSISDSS